MKYKPNWPESRDRLTALWQDRHLGRPCLSITAPQPGGRPWPRAATPEAQWLAPGFLTEAALASIEHTCWAGEAIPSYLLMGGWAVCYGATPRFEWNTIWHAPLAIDWENPPVFALDWDDPWLRRYEAVYRATLTAAGWDDFLVGQPCLLPGNDLLSAILGPDAFFTSLVDRPEWMRAAIAMLAANQAAINKHFRALCDGVHAFPYGNSGWMTFWAPEPYLSTQSDVSCMLSPAMFDEFILPELELLGHEFGALWYHLDGSRAMQHLPRLLSLPYLRVMQFIPEPDMSPNGPDWLDLYRRIQAAGKIVHITVAPSCIEPLVRALDPGLLCIETYCGSAEEAEVLLRDAERWTTTGTDPHLNQPTELPLG